jgi:tetratricopeptide (TPR) repeat protein
VVDLAQGYKEFTSTWSSEKEKGFVQLKVRFVHQETGELVASCETGGEMFFQSADATNQRMEEVYRLTLKNVLYTCLKSMSPQKEQVNLLPMYGYMPKQPFQLEADRKFLEYADKTFKSRKEAAENYAKLGWDYYEKGELETAMKRFNQVWFLDSTNCQSFWGFGNIYGLKEKPEESNGFLRKAQKLGCTSPFLLEAFTSNWFSLYDNSKDSKYLDRAAESIQVNLQASPGNARVLNQKAVYFYYRGNYDSASVYAGKAIKLAGKAIKLDPSSVSPGFLETLKAKQK